ncbi:MAG: helix-turn-helix transcriptional regulator [Candidatus Latescibacteria bacterium]|nr:helix-turn-helix transcriptional regulator [Candidatus Latescibacterota bacterium]
MKQRSDLPALGKNIERIRKQKGFSLEELSQKSGVSKGMLSQIEQEKVNPTVAVVWKIAYGLDVPFHDLITEEENVPFFDLIRKDDTVILERDGGRCVFRIISPLSMAEKLELYTLQIKEKGVLGSDPHSKGTEEFLTVLNGKIAVEIDDQRAILEQGDSIHYHADIHHLIRNESEGESSLYMVVKYM